MCTKLRAYHIAGGIPAGMFSKSSSKYIVLNYQRIWKRRCCSSNFLDLQHLLFFNDWYELFYN